MVIYQILVQSRIKVVSDSADKHRRQNMKQAMILVFLFAVAPNVKPIAAEVVAPEAP